MIYKELPSIPGRALLLFLGFVVVAYVGLALVLYRLRPELDLLGRPEFMLIVFGVFFGIGLAAVIVAVAPLGRAAIPALGLRPAHWKYVVFGALGTLALSVAVSQIGIEPKGIKEVVELLPGNLGTGLLLLAALAPIVEELVFRGLLYGWVAGRWNSLAAWIVSSLAFAAAHWEPAHVILVLPLGLLFGWLRRRTDSLLPSMIAHIINNGFALLAAVYLPGV